MDNNILMSSIAASAIGFSLFGWLIAKSSSKKKLKQYEQYIDDSRTLYHEVFDIEQDSIVIVDQNNEALYLNNNIKKLLGLKNKDNPIKFELPTLIKDGAEISLDDLLENIKFNPYKNLVSFDNLKLKIGRGTVPVSIFVSKYKQLSPNDNKQVRIIIIRDRQAESEKQRIEEHNALTKLPNHLKLHKDLQATFIKLHLKEQKIALAVMEIDNFASLRAILGYDVVNNVLIKFSEYLRSLSDEFSVSIYHTVHNSFVFVLNDINNETDVYSMMNLVQEKLRSLYKMENSSLHLTASVGAAIYPDNSVTGELLNNAYKALSEAKEKGEGWVLIYKPVIKTHGYDELKLYNDMHEGIKRHEFEIFYQPLVDSKTRQVVSAEALIRWKHPEHGMVRPDIFIPIMEKTGFIIELGKYLLEEVLKQQKRWELFKFDQVPISINLSLAELEKDNFVRGVEAQLKKHNVSPELIKYEVTEGLAMQNEERTHQQLSELRKMGISILLDDFGTGYTSFSYLKKIPANIVKLDRSLVINVLTSKTDQGIAKSIIDLAHSIGMQVVVEGIEDEHMFGMLRDMGADFIQGYYISRPVPVFEFQEFLRR